MLEPSRNQPELVHKHPGSMRFDVLEPPQISAKTPCIPCFPCNDVDRGGSVRSNHPEPMRENPTRLAICPLINSELAFQVTM